ncbi:MAG: hypothetical protein ABJM06_11445 [Gilvibacter sp.]
MKESKTQNLIYRRLFLLSVLVLMLNDFYLKFEFHNYFTGKLSDFAGLFAFPYFISMIFKHRIKAVYWATALFFVFWKSSYSQFAFDAFHSMGIGIDRVVDYSDLMALLILPLSYWYRIKKTIKKPSLAFVPRPIIYVICWFAFVATSIPSTPGELNLKSGYETEVNMTLLELQHADFYYLSLKNDRYLSSFYIPEHRADITTILTIKNKENGKLLIRLDSIRDYHVMGSTSIFGSGVKQKDVDYVESLTVEDFERLFIELKMTQLKNKND